MASIRRSDYDITNTVRVSSPQAVLRAIEQLLVSTWPQIALAPVEQAFADFDALFAGRMPGYAGVDTRLSRPPAHARCHAGDGAAARRP